MKRISWENFEDARKRDNQSSVDGRSGNDNDQANELPSGSKDEQGQSPLDEEAYRAFMDAELSANDDEIFEDAVDAMVRVYAGDPEGLWDKLTYAAYDPKRVLSSLKNHHIADSEIDPMALMETFMECYDYRYANYARFAIGNIVGFKHMRLICTRGRSYWQAGLGGM